MRTGRGTSSTAACSACSRPCEGSDPIMLIYIDGDACPVKAETYRVAKRHGVKTLVVANDVMFVPTDPLIELVVVKTGFDSADDWIVERIGPEDVAITSDIPLAERCLKKGARVLGPK